MDVRVCLCLLRDDAPLDIDGEGDNRGRGGAVVTVIAIRVA